jgi:hypothetical protein
MNRRSFLAQATQAAAGVALAANAAPNVQSPVAANAAPEEGGQQPAANTRPNVIWLLADQWRAQELSSNGERA